MDSDIIIRRYQYGTKDYRMALILRYKLLGRSVGVTESDEEFIYESRDYEKNHIMIGAFRGNAIVGSGNMEPQKDGRILLRQFAVAPELRRQGIGTALFNACVQTAKDAGYSRIVLHARTGAAKFYMDNGCIRDGTVEEYPGLTLWGMYRIL